MANMTVIIHEVKNLFLIFLESCSALLSPTQWRETGPAKSSSVFVQIWPGDFQVQNTFPKILQNDLDVI